MRFYRLSLLLVSCIALGTLLPSIVPTRASVVGTGHPVHDNTPQGPQAYNDEFFVHVPPLPFTLAHRDLEFQVDALYSFDRGLSHDQNIALDDLARWIADSPGTNSFRIPMMHLQLVYEYLRQPTRPPYSTDPSNLTSFTTGPDSIYVGAHLVPIPLPDRSNVDYYIYRLGHNDGNAARHGGQYPSAFEWQKEDSTTGHWSQSGNNPPVYQVFHGNSVMFSGPLDPNNFTYPGPAGWNASNRLADTEFGHEFQHSLGNTYGDGAWSQMDEVFACVAEALVGMADPDAGNEVPYAWPIMQQDNYQNWRLFTPYLLFNFLGIDTTRTATGITDDLVYRWSRSPRRFYDLAELLSDQASPELINKGYFHPGGVPLDNSSRLSLLLHNWRVANYVNNASLDQGQYGFAGAFSPWSQRPWQSFDGAPANDAVAVPPEVTARRAWATVDTTIFGYRYQTTPGISIRYPTMLEGYGSEYWVVRSDASLGQGQQDLVVRVTPEGVYHGPGFALSTGIIIDGRLVASVVSYSQQDTPGGAQPLWQHPNWASTAIQPTWVDVDSAAGALEFVVPNFGTSNKAAVVVLSLGDGPLRGLSRLGHLAATDTSWTAPNQIAKLPYRINFAIRTTPYQAQNPLPVAQTPNAVEDFATWSPAGDEIAYVKDDGSNYTRIYRRRLDGSAATPLLPNVTYYQSHPDWSPRGDRVAFDQVLNPIHTDIWIANVAAQTASPLPNTVGNASWPVLQPNGQGLAYLHYFQRSWQSPDSAAVQGYRSEIRTVKLDGTSDAALVISGSQHFASPRWAADGSSVYFTSQDTLYNVRLSDRLVTVVPGPNGDVTSFDLPLGLGPKAIEQPGILFYDPTGSGDGPDPDSSVAFRRVALRDGAGDTQARFYRTSAEFTNPRWSFDGSRIAYSSNQNNPSDRDVFVGQVSYDHPPVLDAGVADRQVEQGLAFDQTISATDADGEPLTYAGAYLPGGSTLSASGQFHWQVPANSAGQSYYVVFRALDPSWGVASRVVRFDVIQGGGCPFADTWTADGWRVENSILGRSLNGSLGLDAYRLKSSPAVEGGRYRLRLRENEQESTVLDQVRLAYVDHAPDARAWALGERVVLGTRVPPYRVTTNHGDDITSLVNGSGSGYFAGQPGDTVLIDLIRPGSVVAPESASPGDGGLDPFEDGDGGKDGASGGGGYRASGSGEDRANPDALVLNSTGILIQGRDEAGVWSTIRRRYPRENNDEFMVDTLDQGPVRMVFVGRHRLNYVGRVVPTAAVTPQALSLLAARHSRLGDVRAALLGAQNETTALTPGDTLGLEFAATPVPAGQVRDFFLLSRGVYTSGATPFASRPAPGSTTPLDYALLQNRPNPFTGGTVIGFDLPRAEGVKLEVFDLAGRRVRMLAEGSYAPGRWSAEWDRRDAAGSLVRPGVYLYRLKAGAFHAERKMVMMP